MRNVLIEFTNDTLVQTEQGTKRLVDLLKRPVRPSLWAIRWTYNTFPNGITFHASHKQAAQFARHQIDSKPATCMKLVEVSDYLYKYVSEYGYCWTDLSDFSEAINYKGVLWKN